MKTSSVLIALHAKDATPHRRIDPPRPRDYASAAFWLAAFIVAVVAIHTFAG